MEDKLFDETFYIKKRIWGTWSSYDKEGNGIITTLTEENCISATRYYLKWKQEGFPDSETYDGNVGGKL